MFDQLLCSVFQTKKLNISYLLFILLLLLILHYFIFECLKEEDILEPQNDTEPIYIIHRINIVSFEICVGLL